jgi:hypothetical protein
MFLDKDQDSEPRVKRAVAIPALRPEFDKFLYAAVSESEGEMPFSVLSALARQNLDPWEEAANLARLPYESAIVRLSSIIPAEPGAAASAPTATATRLIALLPHAPRFGIPSLDAVPGAVRREIAPIVIYVIVGAIIFASALMGN